MKAALLMALAALAYSEDCAYTKPSAFNAVQGQYNYINGQFNANMGDFNQIIGNANGNIGDYDFIQGNGNILGLGKKGMYNSVKGDLNIVNSGSFNALNGDQNFVDGSANGIFSSQNKINGSGNLVVTDHDIGMVQPQIDAAFSDLDDCFSRRKQMMQQQNQKLRKVKPPAKPTRNSY